MMQLKAAAKTHLSLQEFTEALSCLDLAIDLNTSSYKLYRLRAIAHACLGQHAESAGEGVLSASIRIVLPCPDPYVWIQLTAKKLLSWHQLSW